MAAVHVAVWLSTCVNLACGLAVLSQPQYSFRAARVGCSDDPEYQRAFHVPACTTKQESAAVDGETQIEEEEQDLGHVDLSSCPTYQVAPTVRTPPSSCAAQRVAALKKDERNIVITMFTRYPNEAEIVRHVEYHFLLGADLAIIFDNGCPSESWESKQSCDALEYALRPYVESGLVVFRKDYQCTLADDIFAVRMLQRGPMGGSGVALQLMARHDELHQKPGTMIVPLDDDEYIVMNDKTHDLRDLRRMLLDHGKKSAGVRWHIYGTSDQICQPTGSLVRHCTQAIKPEAEATDEEKEEATTEAAVLELNPPYSSHSQKFVVIWENADQIGTCDTHMCGPNYFHQGRNHTMALREAVTDMAFTAHYAYQSQQHWVEKCARRQVPIDVHRKGCDRLPPKRYNEVTTTKALEHLLKKIDDLKDSDLRSCAADMFG